MQKQKKSIPAPPLPDPITGLSQLEKEITSLDKIAVKLDEIGSSRSFTELMSKLSEESSPVKNETKSTQESEKSYIDYLTAARKELENASQSEFECGLCKRIIEEDLQKVSNDEKMIKRATVGRKVMDEMNINKPWEQLDEDTKKKIKEEINRRI